MLFLFLDLSSLRQIVATQLDSHHNYKQICGMKPGQITINKTRQETCLQCASSSVHRHVHICLQLRQCAICKDWTSHRASMTAHSAFWTGQNRLDCTVSPVNYTKSSIVAQPSIQP